MTYRYIFRAKKKKFCYHIVTDAGTACNMQNGMSFRKLDTLSDQPPPNRRLCAICAQLMGLPPPVKHACDAIWTEPPKPQAPKLATVIPPLGLKCDPLLARYGITSFMSDHDHQRVTVELAKEQCKKKYGVECRTVPYGDARHLLKRILSGQQPKLHVFKQTGAAKKSKSVKFKAGKPSKIKIAADERGLTPERIAFIVSDAFLSSLEWRKVRYQAILRSDGCCEACGRGKPHGVVINVDHIHSRRNRPDLALVVSNLQVLCHDCNHGKGNWDSTDWRNRRPEMLPEEREWEREAWERFK